MKFVSSLPKVEHEDEGYVGVRLPNDTEVFYKKMVGNEYLISSFSNEEGFYYDKEGLEDLITVLLELRKELDK